MNTSEMKTSEMNTKDVRCAARGVAGLFALLAVPLAASAGTAATWTGGGEDTLLATGANWEGGAAPDFATGGLTATFASDGERATFAGDGDLSFAGLVFTKPFTLGAAADATGRVLLGAGGVQTAAADGAEAYELGWPLVPDAAQTWYAAANATLRWTAPISGGLKADRILLDGPGTQVFCAANTFTNDMMITNGVVRFVGDGAMGAPEGTTYVDLQQAQLRFGGGVHTRPVNHYRWQDALPLKTICIEAGTTNRIEGYFAYWSSNSKYPTATIELEKDAELVFAGRTGLFSVNFRTADDAPAHLVVTNVPFVVADRFSLSSKGLTVDLWTTKNKVSSNTSKWQAGTLRTRVAYALDAVAYGNAKSRVAMTGADFTLDLCGLDQSLGVLQGDAGTVTSDAPAFLHIAQNHQVPKWDNEQHDGVPYVGITNKVAFTGQAGISLDADAAFADTFPHVLTAASCSSGTVQVTSGRLTLAAPDGAWTNAAAAVVKGGTLVLEHGGALGRWTDVYIEGDGVLELAAGVVQTCRELYFDGVRQHTGAWGSSKSGVARTDDKRFAGTGVLNVLSADRGMTLILR